MILRPSNAMRVLGLIQTHEKHERSIPCMTY